ncbi:MAG: hypothetical protein IK070_03010 [Clostridia bacterium]|nr:hypothetical protein [Clostridia bacterium]
MDKKKYVLYVDDGGGYTQGGRHKKGGSQQSASGSTPGTIKGILPIGPARFFIGVLVPEGEMEDVIEEIAELRSRLGLRDEDEIHATEQNNQNRSIMADYVGGIIDIAKKYGIKIVSSKSDHSIKIQETLEMALQNLYGVNITGHGKEDVPEDEKFTLEDLDPGRDHDKDPYKYKKLSLISLFDSAQRVVGEEGEITRVVCDEDLGKKAGSSYQITKDTTLEFVQSVKKDGDTSELLVDKLGVQMADNMAWFYNRINYVIPGKIREYADDYRPSREDERYFHIWRKTINRGIYAGEFTEAICVGEKEDFDQFVYSVQHFKNPLIYKDGQFSPEQALHNESHKQGNNQNVLKDNLMIS